MASKHLLYLILSMIHFLSEIELCAICETEIKGSEAVMDSGGHIVCVKCSYASTCDTQAEGNGDGNTTNEIVIFMFLVNIHMIFCGYMCI